jgi:hypothetical protein
VLLLLVDVKLETCMGCLSVTTEMRLPCASSSTSSSKPSPAKPSLSLCALNDSLLSSLLRVDICFGVEDNDE